MNLNATLIGQAIAFMIFVWFCMKFVWPRIMNAIEKRQQEISDGLAAAEKARKDLELAQVSATEYLQQAKAEVHALIEQANKRKAQIIDEAKVEAEQERKRILLQGRSEIESEWQRAREELRKQVALLAIAGAEKIIERSIDNVASDQVVDKLIAEL